MLLLRASEHAIHKSTLVASDQLGFTRQVDEGGSKKKSEANSLR